MPAATLATFRWRLLLLSVGDSGYFPLETLATFRWRLLLLSVGDSCYFPLETLATFRWRLWLLSSIDFPYLLSTLAGEENRVGGGERELIRWPGLTHGRKPSCQGSLLHQIKESLDPRVVLDQKTCPVCTRHSNH